MGGKQGGHEDERIKIEEQAHRVAEFIVPF